MKNAKYQEMVCDELEILTTLSLPIISQYDFVLLNANLVYTTNRFDSGYDYKTFMKMLNVPSRPKYGYLTIPPHPVLYEEKEDIKYFTHLGTNNSPMLSASTFGDVHITPKNEKTVFLVTGNINSGQKNHQMVFDAIEKLIEQGIYNFELWINGNATKDLQIPDKIKDYVKYLGDNKPDTLFPILEQCDFIIAGTDSSDEWQKKDIRQRHMFCWTYVCNGFWQSLYLRRFFCSSIWHKQRYIHTLQKRRFSFSTDRGN